MFFQESLRYPFMIASIIFFAMYALTYSKDTLKQYTIDMGLVHLVAHATSWITLIVVYYVMMKWKKLI